MADSDKGKAFGRGKAMVVTWPEVQAWYLQMVQSSTSSAVAQNANDRSRLFSEWNVPELGDRASHLGRAAKWLAALHYIFDGRIEPPKEGETKPLDIVELLGVRHEAVRQLFQPYIGLLKYEKLIKTSERYAVASKPKDNGESRTNEVISAILEHVNKKRDESNGIVPALTADDVNEFELPLDRWSNFIGSACANRFKDWLRTGNQAIACTGVNNAIFEELPIASNNVVVEVAQEFTRPFKAENMETPDTHDSAHEKKVYHRVINITVPVEDSMYERVGRELEGALLKELSVHDSPCTIKRVSLGAGASRAGVLLDLYACFRIRPAALLSEQRPVDLYADMLELRKALSVVNAVIIFEHWDNVSGPFGPLQDFLCNSHWGEFLRALIQPVREELGLDNLTSGRSRFVVISSAAADELMPWVQAPVRSIPGGFKQSKEAEKVNSQQAKINRYREDFKRVAAKFIAGSVNGLQRGTLLRCLQQWSHLFGSSKQQEYIHEIEDKSAFGTFIKEFLEFYVDSLVEVPDGESEGLTAGIRRVELSSRPLTRDESVDEASLAGEAQRKKESSGSGIGYTVQFRSHEKRKEFVEGWLEVFKNGDKLNEHTREKLSDKTNRRFYDLSVDRRKKGWSAINYVLAEEAIRQASALVRHIDVGGRDNPNLYRRFCQAVYHGLLSVRLTFDDDRSGGFLGASRYSMTMPADPAKRYRYLYLFIYRECIEGNEWRLGRAFGRSDVRLDLLRLFVAPHLGPLMLLREGALHELMWPKPGELERHLPIDDPELRCDLLEALGRAGLDVPGGRGATEWALSVLPGWRNGAPTKEEDWRINERLPSRSESYSGIADAALKLRIDWLHSSGDSAQRYEAINLCRQQLARMGIEPESVEELGKGFFLAIVDAWDNKEGVQQSMEAVLKTAVAYFSQKCSNARERKFVADVLFRLAELQATSQPNVERQVTGASPTKRSTERAKESAEQFAHVCAIYWVADRVRSNVGADVSSGLRWPNAGARPFRYYIRASLKLSRLILEAAPKPVSDRTVNMAKALLEHAQNRLGLYTRHQFRFKRERVSVLLLETARIRSWTLVNNDLARDGFLREWQGCLAELMSLTDLAESASRDKLKIQNSTVEKGDRKAVFKTEQLSEANRTLYVAAISDEKKFETGILDVKRKLTGCVKSFVGDVQAQLSILFEALLRMDEAESVLLELGYQRGQVLRSTLETLKFGANMQRIFTLEIPTYLPHPNVGTTKAFEASTRRKDLANEILERAEDLKHRLLEVAERQQLGWHQSRAIAARSMLSEASAGNDFWTYISRRQTEDPWKTLGPISDFIKLVGNEAPPSAPGLSSRHN